MKTICKSSITHHHHHHSQPPLPEGSLTLAGANVAIFSYSKEESNFLTHVSIKFSYSLPVCSHYPAGPWRPPLTLPGAPLHLSSHVYLVILCSLSLPRTPSSYGNPRRPDSYVTSRDFPHAFLEIMRALVLRDLNSNAF